MDNLEQIAQETIQRLKDRLFLKIPELSVGWEQVYVSLVDLKRLTDEEFILLWMLPNIEVRIGKKASAYVQERRRLLGLSANDNSRVKEEAPSPRLQPDEWERLLNRK